MKHLKNLLSQPSAGKASAAVVGQPSAHRRYSRLKHLAFMLLFLLGSVNVWGEDEAITFSEQGYTNQQAITSVSGTDFSITFDKGTNNSNPPKYFTTGTAIRAYGGNTFTVSSSTKTIAKIELTFGSGDGSNAITTDVDTYNNGTWTGSATSITFTIGGTSGNRRLASVAVTYSTGGTPQTGASVTPDPASVDVEMEGVTNQTISLTYDNIVNYETEVSVHPNADGTGTLSPAWLSANVSDADNYAIVTYSVTANDGAARTAYIKVYTTDGDNKEATTIIPVSQVKYVAPFTGSIIEVTKDHFATGAYANGNGDHEISGMTISSTDVYQNSNSIQFKKTSGLMYNKTALGEIAKIEITKTGNNNLKVYYGTSENPETNSITGTADGDVTTYEFEDGYTFFTIGKGSGASNVTPIKIYYYPIESAVTFDGSIENGTVGVTGAADLTAVAAGTKLTLSNTPASGYKLTAYDVYKTGESETKVTVTNNTFTMPAFAVTVSATFEATKNMTGIALSGEYPIVFLTGDAFSHEGMTVTANYDDETSADVTDNATFTGYDMSAADAQTVTVSYTEGTTQTQTYDITVKDAYTVAEILPMVPALNAGSLATRVKGYISQIDSYNSTYSSITYWISADGATTSDQLEVYSGKNVGNTNFSAITDLEVGDFVTITGNVKTHTNGQKEFDKNNYIITGGRIQKGAVTGVVVSGTPSKTTPYTASESTFDPTGLTVTVTYANGFSGVVTEGITWGDDLTDHEVTATGTVNVTATVGGVTSAAYGVSVEFSAKTLVSIAAGTASYTIWKGQALPEPTITATYSEGDPADVSAEASYDTEGVFDNTTADTYIITVSYTFGGEPKTTTYTVEVKEYANEAANPYTVAQALDIIENAIGNVVSADNIYVQGIVSEIVTAYNATYHNVTYNITADGETSSPYVQVYRGKGKDGADLSSANDIKVGDEVIIYGQVKYHNNSTPEFVEGTGYYSLARTPQFEIADVVELEVGAADLAVADLTITQDGEGAVTLASSDHEEFVTIVDGKLHAVAPGTATITANLVANGIYKAATYDFSVAVIAAQVKYAITFDGNGADGGSAPETIADKAAGAPVTLPANAYTKTGYTFDHWKVFYVDGESVEHEVAVTAGAFDMPAFAVTIQAQWTEIPVWAYTYDSNVTVGDEGYTIQILKQNSTTEYDDFEGQRYGTGSAAGVATINVPANTQTLHFHAAAWNNENVQLKVTMSDGAITLFEMTGDNYLVKEADISGTKTTYKIATPIAEYYSIDLSNQTISTNEEITFTATNGKRFVLFGVNQEGGVLPVLDHIAITGTMTNTTGWKTGDDITPEGLTVKAIYTLNNVEQTPVDVTSSVVWSHAALAEGQTEVTLIATYTEGEVQKTANANVTIAAVETGDPTILTDPTTYLNFGSSVEQNTVVAAKTITVTLKNITSATATLGGTNYSAFSIDKTTGIVDGDVITVSVNTATPDTYAGTVTIKDDNSDTEKVINLSMTVVEPEVPETSVSTSSKWVAATEIVDGMNVLIVGVEEVESVKHYYAMGADRGNNRGVVEGTLNEGVLTPGDGTMSFTLVAQDGGTYALRASNGKYLYAGGTGNNNYLNTKAYTGDLDANAKWNIDLANSTIIATSSNRNEMRFNKSNNPKIISCYQSSNTSPTVALYVPQIVKYSVTYAANGGSGDAPAAVEYVEGATFTVAAADLFTAPEGKEFDKWNDGTNDYEPGASYTVGTSDVVLTAQWKDAAPAPVLNYVNIREGVTAGKYYTICLSKKVVAFHGGSFWTLNKRSASVAYLEEVTGVLPAGTPYIFSVNTGEQLEVAYEGDETTTALANGALRGTFVDLVQEAIDGIALNAGSDIYLLSNNTLWNVSTAGSSSNMILAGRAYIVFKDLTLVTEAPQSVPGRRVVAMPMHKDNTTGIDAVNMNVEGVQKVVVDGHMYIVRDGKMFDATGRLVK